MPRPARLRILAAILAGSALSASPAFAQYYGPAYPGPYSYNVPPVAPYGYGPRPYEGGPQAYAGPRPLSPRAIVERLEDEGYDDVGRPRFTGTIYIVDATGPGDIRMRVVVDAIRGIVLNRTALGDGRRFDLREDRPDDDEDRPPRRFGGRPPAGVGPGIDLYGPQARPRAPETPPRREAARPADPVVPGGALPGPADPRLAPDSPAALPPPPAPPRAAPRPRQAARPPEPSGSNPDAPVSGLNPAASPKPKPADPGRTASRPARDMARQPVPSGGNGVAARPTNGEAATADAGRPGAAPKKPVRVIGGVTPMNGGSGQAQLDTLPAPPAAQAPTGVE